MSEEINAFIDSAELYMIPWAIGLSLLWVFNIINWLLGSKLNAFGIYPRRMRGLLGITLSPLLHKNFNHLFFNTIPLFFLGLAILIEGENTFLKVSLFIICGGGLGVWLFGRRALHIGASGLVAGYFGYILLNAYLRPGFTAVFLALLVSYYFGGIFLGIFPQESKVSWESHLWGFIAGISSHFI